MPRRKPPEQTDPDVIDANQVVAYNFRKARELRSWTQDETALRLGGHLGTELKKTSISAIERSVESDRRRVFTAQEIAMFAVTFDVPIVWFFIPPDELDKKLEGADIPIAELWTLLLGHDLQMPELEERLTQTAVSAPSEAMRAATSGFEFEPSVTWAHYERYRTDRLLDLVTEQRDRLDDLFEQMRNLVEEWETRSMRYAVMGDQPRRAYTNTAKIILGQEIWELLANEIPNFTSTQLSHLLDQDNVPWERLIDVEENKELLLRLAAQIESAALLRRDDSASK